ncbi:MAG: hypothetical protein ACI9OJ_003473 [Myxococcota bacterium]|jgi:hypothetical protein
MVATQSFSTGVISLNCAEIGIPKRVGAAVLLSGLLACSAGVQNAGSTGPKPGPEPEPAAAAGFPTGYEAWSQFESSPATRKASGEIRELHHNTVAKGAGAVGRFPTGSILVKAQHRMVGNQKGRLFQLAVMRKQTGGDYGGWKFEAYDPKSLQAVAVDADVCAICHTQRSQTDFVFSTRESW